MAGKGQFAAGGEDAHLIVGTLGRTGCTGRQQERGFGQVGPLRKVLHLCARQVGAIQHHGQRVAQVGGVGKDIKLFEGAGFHGDWGAGVQDKG